MKEMEPKDAPGSKLGNILGLKNYRSSKICAKTLCTGTLPESTDGIESTRESSFTKSSGSRIVHNVKDKIKPFYEEEYDSQYFSGEVDVQSRTDLGCFQQSFMCSNRSKATISDSRNHRRSKSVGKTHDTIQFNEYYSPQDLPPTLLRWMDSLSYEEYAYTNFAPQFTGKWGGMSTAPAPFESLPYFIPQPPEHAILRSVNNHQKKKKLVKLSVSLFRNLMQYMGDSPSRNTATHHAAEIIKAGIQEPHLRDEIYCQILKQIHGNPSSRSMKKGWKMLSICAATFPPSPQLKRLLESVFHENLYNADPFCLARMQKVSKLGARICIPSAKEIRSIERSGTVDVQILAPGQYRLLLSLDPTTTVDELGAEVASRFCLPNHSLYGIFKPNSGRAEVSLSPETYLFDHMEEEHSAEGKKPNRAEDSDPLWRILFERGKHSVVPVKSFSLDPLSSPMESQAWDGHQSIRSDSSEVLNSLNIFIFKRKVFANDRAEDETSLHFEYHQAVYDCLTGIYSLKLYDAVMVMAHILHSDYSSKESNLSPETIDRIKREYRIPEAWLSDVSREDFFERVFEALDSMAEGEKEEEEGTSDVRTRQKSLLNYLKTHCEFYGFSWFWVEQNKSAKIPNSITLTIGLPGVWILDRASNRVLLRFKYTEIYSWAYSLSAFQLVVSDGEKNEKFSFCTDRGYEIASVIQNHVNCIVNAKKEEDITVGDDKLEF